jgi:hypothetical protein
VVLLTVGSTGFRNAAAFTRHISTSLDIWTSAMCVLLLQRPDREFGGLQLTCAQRW